MARQRLRELVHETALNDLSDVDREFLAAMAVDDGPSRVADLARRDSGSLASTSTPTAADSSPRESSRPRRAAEVDFAIPYLRDTLRQSGRAQLTVVSSWVARVSTT